LVALAGMTITTPQFKTTEVGNFLKIVNTNDPSNPVDVHPEDGMYNLWDDVNKTSNTAITASGIGISPSYDDSTSTYDYGTPTMLIPSYLASISFYIEYVPADTTNVTCSTMLSFTYTPTALVDGDVIITASSDSKDPVTPSYNLTNLPVANSEYIVTSTNPYVVSLNTAVTICNRSDNYGVIDQSLGT
jgi:hypothetical protein